MSFVVLDFKPASLGFSTTVKIYLPDLIKDDMPVLYLLHGMSGDCNSWINGSSIGRFAKARGMAVVMPSAENSFYTNMKYGAGYFDYVSRELPEYIGNLFTFITKKREKTFIAGLSMGGYGAIKIALRTPERFSAAASLSGALDIAQDVKLESEGWHKICVCNWGEDYMTSLPGSDEDLLHLVDSFPSDCPKPRLYVACGTEDYLYSQNITFRNHMEGKGFEFTYEEGPGSHTWGFWGKWIVPVIKFFFEPLDNTDK